MNALLASAFSFCASSLSCSVTSFASDILRVASAGDGAEDGGVEPDGPGEDGAELDGLLLMIVIFVESLQTGGTARTVSGTMAEGCRVQEISKPMNCLFSRFWSHAYYGKMGATPLRATKPLIGAPISKRIHRGSHWRNKALTQENYSRETIAFQTQIANTA